MAANRPGRTQDEHEAVREHLGDVADPTREHQWNDWLADAPEVFRGAPTHRQQWLRDFFVSVKDVPRIYGEKLLAEIQHLGLMRSLLHQIDKDDLEKPRDAWCEPNLLGEVFPKRDDPLALRKTDYPELLMDCLAEETDPFWRGRIIKWLPIHQPLWKDLTATLTALLEDSADEARWFAAIHLARIAPQTPGLVPVLIEALHGEWQPYAGQFWEFGASGRSEAAAALARVGPLASPALPHLHVLADETTTDFDPAIAFVAAALIKGRPAEALRRLSHEVSAGDACHYINAWAMTERAGIPALVAARLSADPAIRDAGDRALERMHELRFLDPNYYVGQDTRFAEQVTAAGKLDFLEEWRTPAARELAQEIVKTGDAALLPKLGEALDCAGCHAPALLAWCREPGHWGHPAIIAAVVLGADDRLLPRAGNPVR
jgi:hypothetical protein